MGKTRFAAHTILAAIILIVAALWVTTGTFSSVGSEATGDAAGDDTSPPPDRATPETLQSVAFILASPEPRQRHIRLSGQTEADKRIVLIARTSGAVEHLPVSDGSVLAEGGLVMQLEGRDRLAALSSAEAQARVAELQAESDRKLAADGNLPKMRLKASIAAREAARSAVAQARSETERLALHAPFAGLVDKVAVEIGTWVQPGTEIATFLSLDPIVVVAEIGERDLQSIAQGTTADVAFGNGIAAQGTVRHIRREAMPLTRTFPLEIAVPNPEGRIFAGMSADVVLTLPTAPAVILKRSAITLDAEGAIGVRVLSGDDTVGFLGVEILDDTPDGLVIGGVPDGTRIIVAGQDLVSDGQKVTAVAAADTER